MSMRPDSPVAREWLAQPGHHLVRRGSDDYPPQLARVDDAPEWLFVAGDPACLWHPQLAIVGSRNATENGLATARDFAATLARAGLAITSGLADGIDGAAHAGALDADGLTLAVCATGLAHVYPRKHAVLATRIAARGALVSEYPPDTQARPGQFPRRNRIIAGLALGTLVVEASLRSGSLITARLAGENGREVFAIPGSIHNPMARGCHRLIRDGAKLVESAQDVLDELGAAARDLGGAIAQRLARVAEPAVARGRTDDETRLRRARASEGAPPPARDDPDYRRLRAALGHDALTVDALVARSGLTAQAVSSMLLLLELDGEVAAQAGGRYALASRPSNAVAPREKE
jgi:DNA processing protein